MNPLKRTYIVDRTTQTAILLYTFIVGIASVVMSAFCFLLILRARVMSQTDGVTGDAADPNNFIYFSVAASLFCIGFLVFTGLLMSNRIAGPVWRIRQHMRRIASGEPIEPISFRKADHFSDLAADYNEVLVRLKAAEAGRTPSPTPSSLDGDN